MNARYYVAEIGRFASADIIVPDPQNPQSFNRYSYVLNSPVNYTDPSGHCILGGADGASGGTDIGDEYYDCSILVPPSTNPTGETMNVQGLLRILAMLEGTEYENMDIFEAALWWNTVYRRLDPFVEPLHDEYGDFKYSEYHKEQLAALRKAYEPGQLESMARQPRNNDLSQFELGSTEGVSVPYMNTLFNLNGSVQLAPFVLKELGLGIEANDIYASNFEPNYLNAIYAYNPEVVDKIILNVVLLPALEVGHTPIEYRELTTLPSDLPSPQK